MAEITDSIFWRKAYPEIDADREFIGDWAYSSVVGDGAQKGNARLYALMMFDAAKLFGLSPTVLLAQFLHETGRGTSDHWLVDRNPAGIGIWGDGAQTPWTPGVYQAIPLAAHIHVVEMWVRSIDSSGWILSAPTRTDFVNRVREHFITRGRTKSEVTAISNITHAVVDRNWDHIQRVKNLFSQHPNAMTSNISSLNRRFANGECTWACDPEYRTKMVGWIERIEAGYNKQELPVQPAEEMRMEKLTPTVILLAGHRQTVGGGGTPGESARTPKLAAAYQKALKEIGVTTHFLQAEDGDNDPDDTVGGLDVTSHKALLLAQKLIAQGAFVVLLDLHFEGAHASVRGLFSIYPRSNGLTTGAPVGNQGADAAGSNIWDETFGARLSARLSEATGIPLRSTGVVRPGLMGEHQTGVGGQGYRLATFAYTAPVQNNCIRLVVEHGALTNAQDKAIIDAPDFYDKVGSAVKKAFRETFNVAGPIDEPAPGQVPSGNSTPSSYGQVSEFNGAFWYPLGIVLEVGEEGARAKVNGGTETPFIYTYPKGTKLKVDWLVRGQGGVWYYVTRDRLRIPVTEFGVQYVIAKEVI